MLEIDALIEKARKDGASDIHLVRGLPPKCRIDGNITDLTDEILTPEACEAYARALAGEDYAGMERIGELDLAKSSPAGPGPV